MFYLEWVSLIVIGVGGSLIAFFWALRTGQFSDQERARYLPLSDEYPVQPARDAAKRAPEVYALFIVIGLGLAAMFAAIYLTLRAIQG